MIQKGTAILDVGGGSLQVSLFDKDALVTTQGLKMGSFKNPPASAGTGENNHSFMTSWLRNLSEMT